MQAYKANLSIEAYVKQENIALFRKQLAASENDPARDEVRHQMLLRLLSDEEAK